MEEDLNSSELATLSLSREPVDPESVHEELLTAFQAENITAVKACLKKHANLEKLLVLYKNAVSGKYSNGEILRLCLMRMLTLGLRAEILQILDGCKPETIKKIVAEIDYDFRVQLDAVDKNKYKNICAAAEEFTREECATFFRLHGFLATRKDTNIYDFRSNVGNITFSAAAFKGDVKKLETILAEDKLGARLVTQRLAGITPLHCAALAGRVSAVNFLLSKGANPLSENNKKKTSRQLATDPDVQAILCAAEEKMITPERLAATLVNSPTRSSTQVGSTAAAASKGNDNNVILGKK